MRDVSKLLLAVISIFVLFGFNACSSETETYESDKGKMEIEREGERADITVKTKEGETFKMTVNKGELPENWPAEVPVIPGGDIILSQSESKSDMQHISIQADENMNGALEFYKNKLSAGGWDIENTMTMPQMNMVTAKKNDRELMLQIAEAEGKSQIQIFISMQ